jgi:hypothetical protein
MSGTDTAESGQAGPQPRSMRIYILVALALIAVIVVLAAILITKGRGKEEAATPTAVTTTTISPTFTPDPNQAPADTPSPMVIVPSLIMTGTDTPTFDFVSAGARPSDEWTGFFGQVTDAQGNPLPDVPLIVWYPDGVAASPVVRTDADGNYEIRLANGVLAGVWSIQVLTDDMQAASKLQTFRTDENTETGIQNIQVLWQKVR